MRRGLLAAIAAAALLPACPASPAPSCDVSTSFSLEEGGELTGPTMRPGNNCLRCHSKGGQAGSHPFTLGGTVFPAKDSNLCEGVAGVTIRVTDARGVLVSLETNAAGNFWSEAPLTPPFRIEAERAGRVAKMPIAAPTGGCALCHGWPDAVSGAEGRIRAP